MIQENLGREFKILRRDSDKFKVRVFPAFEENKFGSSFDSLVFE
jgi:hypothetical protein